MIEIFEMIDAENICEYLIRSRVPDLALRKKLRLSIEENK